MSRSHRGRQEFTCEFCGTKFKAYSLKMSRQNKVCCGKDCPKRPLGTYVESCLACGGEFRTYNSVQSKFCSNACRRAEKVIRQCEICRTEFEWITKYGAGRFCSDFCRMSWIENNVGKIEANCDNYENKYSPQRRAIYRAGDNIDRMLLFLTYDWICHICEEPINPRLRFPHRRAATVDHVIPLSRGGTHTWDNVRPAHADCNHKKAAEITIGDKDGQTEIYRV